MNKVLIETGVNNGVVMIHTAFIYVCIFNPAERRIDITSTIPSTGTLNLEFSDLGYYAKAYDKLVEHGVK